jgi:hypothetical protein
MRQVGWAAGFGVFAIIAASSWAATPAAACVADNGCDDALKVAVESPQIKSDPDATATPDVGAPLTLHSRKSSARSKTQPARQTTAAKPRKAAVERDVARTTIKDAPQSVKNANAEAPHADSVNTAAQAVPIVGADEVNEIDAAAATPELTQDTPKQDATPGLPPAKLADSDKPQPRLALARIESIEQTENVSKSDSNWGNTSTIGKIFIALGGFLTAASAIRMFVG